MHSLPQPLKQHFSLPLQSVSSLHVTIQAGDQGAGHTHSNTENIQSGKKSSYNLLRLRQYLSSSLQVN